MGMTDSAKLTEPAVAGHQLACGAFMTRHYIEVDPRQAVMPRPTAWGISLNPFQEDVTHAMLEAPSTGKRWLMIEAPTAAGKTFLVRYLPSITKRPVVAIFPTRLLCSEQVVKLDGVVLGRAGGTAMKGDELAQGALDAFEAGRPVVMTPDAFHLLVRGRANRIAFIRQQITTAPPTAGRGGRTKKRLSAPGYSMNASLRAQIQKALSMALVIWDEQHLLAHEFAHLALLLRLLASKDAPEIPGLGATVAMMSGTLQIPSQYAQIERNIGFRATWLRFDESMERAADRGESLVDWTSPLHVEWWSPDPDDRATSLYNRIQAGDPCHPIDWVTRMDAEYPGRCLVILDNVARAVRLRDEMQTKFGASRVVFWSQDLRDPRMVAFLRGEVQLPEDAIVLGTSSLDVGIDPGARNLWTEASNLASTLQRLGRIGRPTGALAQTKPGAICLVFPRPVSLAASREIQGIAEQGKGFQHPVFLSLLQQNGATRTVGLQIRRRVEGFMLRESSGPSRMAFVLPSGEIITATPSGMLQHYHVVQDPLGWRSLTRGQRQANLAMAGATPEVCNAFLKHHGRDPLMGVARVRPLESARTSSVQMIVKGGGSYEWVERGKRRTLLRIN